MLPCWLESSAPPQVRGQVRGVVRGLNDGLIRENHPGSSTDRNVDRDLEASCADLPSAGSADGNVRGAELAKQRGVPVCESISHRLSLWRRMPRAVIG